MSEVEVQEQMCKSDTIKLRNRHIGKSCKLFYGSDPLKIVRGKGQYMYDEQGTRYLDCINNVAHVGHCHPKVVEAGTKQMALLSTNNRFLHDEMVKCAQSLTDKMPGDELSIVYFVNSGSEANDLALRIARTYTKQKDIITLDHAYHGHLTSIMEISPYKYRDDSHKPDYVHVAPCPDSYRGKYNQFNYPCENLGELYADDVRELIESNRKNRGAGVAAYIAETLQSCGGQILPPDDYFDRVYKIVRESGGLIIADEVQVGFGRIGTHYWAFDKYNVIPDIVTVAKPMGNGYPVGAVITTPRIAERFAGTGISYFNTYGGNAVSCAIANAVMDVIDSEHLQENARIVGDFLLEQCTKLKQDFEIVGDVRGAGLFIGIELIRDRDQDRRPATGEANWCVNRMKNQHHILVSSDGPQENVLKLKPPMLFNIDNAKEFLNGIRECLTMLQTMEEVKNPIRTILTSGVVSSKSLTKMIK